MSLSSILIVAVIILVPISIGILILYGLLKNFGKPKTARTVRNYLFIAMGIGFITYLIIDWNQSRHYAEIELDNNIKIEVSMREVDSFRDQPIDFEISISSEKANKQVEIAFQGDGAYFRFLRNKKGEIWINGYDRNQGRNWVVDLKKGKVSKSQPENPDEFSVEAELLSNYEIEKRNKLLLR